MSKLLITTKVPVSRGPLYVSNGWKIIPTTGTELYLTIESHTNADKDQTVELREYNPYLIQRGLVKSLAKQNRVSEAVKLDYMGSAEFEFGALPQALRVAKALLPMFSTFGVDDQLVENNEDSVLYFCGVFDTVQQKLDYLEKLNQVIDRKLYTQESIRFDRKSDKLQFEDNCNFWWDIKNHVFFSTNQELIKLIPSFVKNSVDYMGEK
jgi:hypothetical protein